MSRQPTEIGREHCLRKLAPIASIRSPLQALENAVLDTLHDLPIGAHLTTPRRGYVHHGIYAGDGRVVHYAGFSRMLRRGPVEEVPIAAFARGRRVQVSVRAAPKFGGAASVERARSRLGEDRYRLWSNNCEHFVEWCITGSGRSLQVEALAARMRRGWAVFGAAIGLKRLRRSAFADGPALAQ